VIAGANGGIIPAVDKISNFFKHGLVALVVAWLISYGGRGETRFKSAGVFLMAIWLIFEVWAWIVRQKPWDLHRWNIGCTLTDFILIAALLVTAWFAIEELQKQRDDVWQNLRADPYVIGPRDDPMTTLFTVTNGSRFEISKKHQIICGVNIAIDQQHAYILGPVETAIVNDKMVTLWSDNPDLFPHTLSTSRVTSGGDVQTDACLRVLNFASGTECVDLTLTFWYALESQPDMEQQKRFRMVAFRNGDGEFKWVKESLNSGENYCQYAIKKR